MVSFARFGTATTSAEDLAVETILADLLAPHGVAIRPGGSAEHYEIFVSETGRGRIVTIGSDQAATTEAIAGFDSDLDDGKLSGPFGLVFLDRSQLVVACAGQPVVRMFALPQQFETQQADEPKQAVKSTDAAAAHRVARTRANDLVPDLLVFTGDMPHWPEGLAKINVRAGTIDKLRPLIRTSSTNDLVAHGITISDQGYVVTARRGSSADADHSELTFYDPRDGTAIMSTPTPGQSFTALAYSSISGNLYALDERTRDERGGVYRIDDASRPGKPACKVVKIADIDRPTACAFAPDGALYVTTRGQVDDGPGQGKLLKLTGNL